MRINKETDRIAMIYEHLDEPNNSTRLTMVTKLYHC